MEFESILSNVARHISLTGEETEYFVSLLKKKSISRKEFLLKEGEPCTDINFVCKGALRAFYKDRDDRESTIMFAVTDWWITDMNCFIHQAPANLYIEAIEESEVFQLGKANLDTLYEKVPKFERFFRILMQNSYVREQMRVLQNLSLPAEERYHNFLQKYPAIAQQVTQKQIASYLGITPEFLSTLRKNASKGIIS